MDADTTGPRMLPGDRMDRADAPTHAAFTMLQQRHDRRLAAKEAAIVYLRAELERTNAALRTATDKFHHANGPPVKRPSSTRDDPTMQFLRDRQSSGLRQELLRSGLTIRRLQNELKRERQNANERLASVWRFEAKQSSHFFAFHRRELNIQMDRREADWAARRFELDQIQSLHRPAGAALASAVSTIPPVPPRATLNDVPTQRPLCVFPLTCVRVVGECRLPTAKDVLPLISSFTMSTTIPLDLVVSRRLVHVVSWLLHNGVKPTSHTTHVAVNTGSLEMVQIVFGHMKDEALDTDAFTDLPIGDHTEIAEWLVRAYPSHMARELTRITSTQVLSPQDQWTRHVDQLKRHWEWENAVDEQCWQRKRARLRSEV